VHSGRLLIVVAHPVKKIVRFAQIYGPRRALFKALGRLRFRSLWPSVSRSAEIGIIGCGQFAFSTISFFLRQSRRRVLVCYDIDPDVSASFARSLGVPLIAETPEVLLRSAGLKYVYVASNHASHSDYAISALLSGKCVYVEKPVAVTFGQLVSLEAARRSGLGRIYAGYNRPFSGAIRDLRRCFDFQATGGVSFNCFVAGHVLEKDHWYRKPGEGTRICGNLGHWIDLFFHVLFWRGLPDNVSVSLTWASSADPDDNLVLSISSDSGDIFSVMLTSRSEPFEGINESIQIQHSSVLCKIDDFREMTIWKGPDLVKKRYWPKDPGHKKAITQPFDSEPAREWGEILLSTLVILRVTEMVQGGTRSSSWSLRTMLEEFEAKVVALERGGAVHELAR
jgi:predicted dehydrogenase